MRSSGLVPRVATWALGGLGAAAVLSLTEFSSWGPVVGTGGVAMAVGVGVLGRRDHQRHLLQQSLRDALVPFLGERAIVVMNRWRGWPGTPKRIVLTYDPTAKDGDIGWRQAVVDGAERRLDAAVTIDKHDRRKRRMVLTTHSTAEPSAAAEARVKATITSLLGAAARVGAIKYDEDGNPTSVAVNAIPTAKLGGSPGYRAKIERTFGSAYPGRWRCTWDLHNDKATFELRPTFPAIVHLPRAAADPKKDVLRAYDRVEISFGVDEDGHELTWKPAIDPNLMVVGAPGTGKTVFEHSILCSVAQYGWPIWVVDGKAIEFLGFRDWPNVQIVASAVMDQLAVIHRAYEVMEHRYQLIVQGKAAETDFEPLMLFIDEWSDFRANLKSWYAAVKVKGMPTQPPVLEEVASLARKGRSSRVHLLFATQRPDAEYFGGDMRDNFRARISMGRLSAQGAQMMWLNPAIGTTVPRGKRGRATTISDDNRAIEVQTYWVPDPRKARRNQNTEELEVLTNLLPEESLRRHERLLILEPRDVDARDNNEVGYHAWRDTQWVKAADHPDLDPLTNDEMDAASARDLSSPMAMFGLVNTATAPGRYTRESVDEAVDDHDGLADELADDDFGESFAVDPMDLSIGDLFEKEPGYWVTVDEDPTEDDVDAGEVLVFWRDDEDESGVLSLPAGQTVNARTATEELV